MIFYRIDLLIKVYRKPKGGLIGIDIGSTSIKKLELSKQGDKYQVDDYAVVPLPNGAVVDKNIAKQEDVVACLEKMFNGKKDVGSGIAFAIPTSAITLRVEDVDPILTENDIEQHVNAQLSKYIPFPVSEVCMDFAINVSQIGEKVKKQVVVVAAKNDSVHPKAEAFEMAGIKVNVATAESFAVEKVLPFIIDPNDKSYVALFDIGFSTTTLYVVKGGKIVYSRDHEFGGNQLTKEIQDRFSTDAMGAEEIKVQRIADGDEDFKDEILLPFFKDVCNQLNQALTLCTSSSEVSEINSILLAGGSASMGGLPEFIEEELGFDVSIACPFDRMLFAPTVDKTAFNKDRASLLTVCGLALCDVGDSINLLPWREHLNQFRKRKYILGAVLAGVVGFSIAFGSWSYFKGGYNANATANENIQLASQEVDRKLEEYKEVTTLRDTMLERMKLIKNLQTTRPTIVMVTNSVVQALPPEAYLTTFSKDDKNFTFVGKARDAEVVAQFMRSLRDSSWFDDISMTSFASFKEESNINVDVSDDKKPKKVSPEDKYGTFTVTATLSDYAINREAGKPTNVTVALNENSIINEAAVIAENNNMEQGESAPNQVENTQPSASPTDGAVQQTAPNSNALNDQEVGEPAPSMNGRQMNGPQGAPENVNGPRGRFRDRADIPMMNGGPQPNVNGGSNE